MSSYKEIQVNLKRLIVKTEGLIKSNNGELKGIQLARYHSNLSLLKQYMNDLKHNNDGYEMDGTLLCEIENKIEQLSSFVDEKKLVTSAQKNNSQIKKLNLSNSIDESFEYLIQRKAEEKIKNELFEVPEPLKEEEYNEPIIEDLRNDLLSIPKKRNVYQNNEDMDKDTNSDDIKGLLSNQKQIQENYTDDLVKLAATLKANSLAFTDLLKKDEKVRDNADTLLQNNVTYVQHEGKKLKQLINSTKSTKWLLYFILLIVFVLFILTYVFIKLFPAQR